MKWRTTLTWPNKEKEVTIWDESDYQEALLYCKKARITNQGYIKVTLEPVGKVLPFKKSNEKESNKKTSRKKTDSNSID